MRVYRLLAIIMLLLNKEKVSATELAGEFEVSNRTIYRDIEAICQAGIPIVSYQGMDGGFSIMDNYKIDKNLFTPDELLSILAALEGLNSTMNDNNIKTLSEKIRTLQPDGIKAPNMKNQLVVDLNPWGENREVKERLYIIKEAINNSTIIYIEYLSLKNKISRRNIEPITLVLKGTTWYLFAYCQLRNDYRVFRLSRIRDINILDGSFEKHKKSFKKFEEENEWRNPGKPVELELSFKESALLRLQDFFSTQEIEKKKDGKYLVRVTFPEDKWVYGFILSFGDSVEVLNPPHVRNIIKNKAKEIYEKYI